jgi:hypothetical protein
MRQALDADAGLVGRGPPGGSIEVCREAWSGSAQGQASVQGFGLWLKQRGAG